MNVPKLRFKEFTDEWNYTCLSEISAEITYGMNSASTEFDGLNKYIRITDIDDETGNFKPSNLVSPLNKPEDKFLVKKDDILFARTGASTGKTYLYNIKDGKLYFAGFLIKAHIVNHNSNFIFQQTKLEKYKKWVKLTSMRSGQPGINSEEYGKCVFSITSLSEENKIAQFLSLLDKKIELQTKKIEALKLFKKGLVTILFNNLKDFKKYKLGALCNITTGKLDANAMSENGKYRFYTCAKNYSFIDKYAFDTEALLISGNGSYVGYIHYYKGKFNAYQRTYVLTNFTQNIQFIKCYLEQNLSKRINSEKKEGNTPYIVLSTLSNMVIKIPNKKEQIKISNIINYHNSKIELENKKLVKLYELKKGFMQSMFV